MRAAVLRGGRMVYRDDVPEPTPGPGQVLVAVRACGICGSDLHFAAHCEEVLSLSLIPWMGDFERWSPGWWGVAGGGNGPGACVICWPVPAFPCCGFLGSGLGGRVDRRSPSGQGARGCAVG